MSPDARLTAASAAGVVLKFLSGRGGSLPSGIEFHLQSTVDLPDGPQFIVFIPDSRYEGAFRNGWPQAANFKAIEALIRLHGLDTLGHTPQRQVELWQRIVAPVANFFWKLKDLEPLEADGAPSTLTRAVLDGEVGGLLYAAVGSHGWLFAATLDQQPMNSGLAEKHFAAAAKGILKFMDDSIGSNMRNSGL
jgi:hypothetical protein